MAEHDEELEQGEARTAGGSAGFLAGVIVGAVVGAGIALLFAPEAGARTRRRLGRRLRGLGASARSEIDDLSSGAERELARRKKQLRRRARQAGW